MLLSDLLLLIKKLFLVTVTFDAEKASMPVLQFSMRFWIITDCLQDSKRMPTSQPDRMFLAMVLSDPPSVIAVPFGKARVFMAMVILEA